MIKVVNSDKGGKYYGRYDETRRNPRLFAKYLQDCGIDVRYTTPRTPKQNGIVERRNRKLLDTFSNRITNYCLNKKKKGGVHM